jgi:hypothetical protein
MQNPIIKKDIHYGHCSLLMSHSSALCIATGYGLDEREIGVQVPAGSGYATSPNCLDRLWGQPSLLSSGHRE